MDLISKKASLTSFFLKNEAHLYPFLDAVQKPKVDSEAEKLRKELEAMKAEKERILRENEEKRV